VSRQSRSRPRPSTAVLPWVEWEYTRLPATLAIHEVINVARSSSTCATTSTSSGTAASITARMERGLSGIDSGRDCVSAGSYVDLPAQLATTATTLPRWRMSRAKLHCGTTCWRSTGAQRIPERTALEPAAKFYQNLASTSTFDLNQDGPQGLWTLIGRVPTAQQVQICSHIAGSNRLYRYHPVPSVSAASPYYYAAASGTGRHGPRRDPDGEGLVAQGPIRRAYGIARRDVEDHADVSVEWGRFARATTLTATAAMADRT